ncbi:MAG: alpha/beta fold hydrolase [Burkholderiales bacterium]
MQPIRNALIAMISLVISSSSLVWAHGPDLAPHQMATIGDIKLESGAVVRNVLMSYVTYGKLNSEKSNAVLLLHGFGANHHLFDHLIGAGKAFDPDKYYIIVPDTFGNSQSSFKHSTSPTNSGLKMRFPSFTTRDMITAEHKLVTETLDIPHVMAVGGISMGAQKSVQFAVKYPDFMDGIIPISGTGLWGSQGFHYLSHLQSIIESCEGWDDGAYVKISEQCGANGLQAFVPYFYSREWWNQNITSPESYKQWWDAWWGYYLGVQDARDLLYQSQAIIGGALNSTPGFNGDAIAALKSIKARTMFIVSPYDQFFEPSLTATANSAIERSSVVSIDSNAGHLICCGADPEATWAMAQAIRGFLGELEAMRVANR